MLHPSKFLRHQNNMKFKKVEPQEFDCTRTAMQPKGRIAVLVQSNSWGSTFLNFILF